MPLLLPTAGPRAAHGIEVVESVKLARRRHAVASDATNELEGQAVSIKSGDPPAHRPVGPVLSCVRTRRQFPIRVTVVECPSGKLLLVPLIVSVKVPLSGTVTVIVVEPVPGMVPGLNVAVGPTGEEAIAKLTFSLKPPDGVIVTVYWTVVPALTLWLPGDAEIEKSLPAVTVTETALDVLPL